MDLSRSSTVTQFRLEPVTPTCQPVFHSPDVFSPLSPPLGIWQEEFQVERDRGRAMDKAKGVCWC